MQNFKAVATRFGRQQRKTIRATISLIAIIVLFVVCNSIKVVVDGYRVWQVGEIISLPNMLRWPYDSFSSKVYPAFCMVQSMFDKLVDVFLEHTWHVQTTTICARQ